VIQIKKFARALAASKGEFLEHTRAPSVSASRVVRVRLPF
jgi:hypothetical protein